jgi:cysteine desulfurase/selenocysteine lyase
VWATIDRARCDAGKVDILLQHVKTRIYLDNAATSFPKPAAVWEAVAQFATQNGSSPGRGQYAESREGARLIGLCRERIAMLLHGGDAGARALAKHVIFALNTSDALNLAIKGVVRAHRLERGMSAPVTLVTTAMDHNSVLRPFAALTEEGARVVHVEPEERTGIVQPAAMRRVLRELSHEGVCPTLVALNWVSNVSGTIQPIKELVQECKAIGAPTLVDVAQGLGHVPFDVREVGCDLVAFPGHKGLLGPQGTGGLFIRPGFENKVATTREGGTGSIAELDAQPVSMPERYEAGSHNTVGIVGLSEGVAYLLERTVQAVREHELALIDAMVHELVSRGARFFADDESARVVEGPLSGVRVLGTRERHWRTGTFSLVHDQLSAAEIAMLLEQQAGVLARAGIHCAPLAHRAFGTLDHATGRGAVRMSMGPFVSADDVRVAVGALAEICEQALMA